MSSGVWHFVPVHSFKIIEGGREGLIDFLKEPESAAWESGAFVIVRSSRDGFHVFSPEEFWLAAYPFLDDAWRASIEARPYINSLKLRNVPSLRDILVIGSIDRVKPVIGTMFNIYETTRVKILNSLPDSTSVTEPALVLPPKAIDSLSLSQAQGAFVAMPGTLLADVMEDAVTSGRTDESFRGRDMIAPPRKKRPSRGLPVLAPPIPSISSLAELRKQLRGALIRTSYPDVETSAESTLESEVEIVSRTPHMDLSAPEPITPGNQFTVLVYVDRQPARASEDGGELEILWPRGVPDLDLHVWLVTTTHFKVVGPSIQSLRLGRSESRSAAVSYRVVARDFFPRDTEMAKMTAYFQYNGRPCGRVSRRVKIASEI